MLTNEQRQDLSKSFKEHFFLTLMHLHAHSSDYHFIIRIILRIIKFIFSCSIYFTSNSFQPQMLNNCKFIINLVFQMFLLTQLASRFNISLNILKLIILIISILINIFFIGFFKGTFRNYFVTKLLLILLNLHVLLIVPIMHLLLNLIQNGNSQNFLSIFLDIVYVIMVVLSSVITALFVLFRVNPFRKKSINWNLQNKTEFYYFLLSISSVFILQYDQRKFSFFILNIFVLLVIRRNHDEYLTLEIQKVENLISNLYIALIFSLILRFSTDNQIVSTQIWLFLNFIILLSFIKSYWSIFSNQRYIPLCTARISEFYDFYFHILQEKIRDRKQNISIGRNSQDEKILNIHLLNCQQKDCIIKNSKLSPETYCEDIESLCNVVIEKKSRQSVDTQVIYELWKFQTGNKYNFRMQNKEISIFYEYVIFYSLNLSKLNQVSDSINAENIKTLKSLFYDKFQNCLLCFSLFYGEISKSQPKLETILSLGNDIRWKANQLKNIYHELLKHSAINFKTAELFVEFQNFFLKKQLCSNNQKSIDRMIKIQKQKNAENIDENYLPTFSFYSDTGLVENMNTECLAFFKMTRFEIKSRKLGELIYPQISETRQIKERLKLLKNNKGYTFFIKGDDVCFGSLTIRQKYIENKKFDIVTIEKEQFSDFKNIYLIDKNSNDLISLLKQESNLKTGSRMNFLIKWRYLYEKYIAFKIEDLISSKVIKMRIQEYDNTLFVLSLSESIHSGYLIVSVKYLKDLQKSKARLSTYLTNFEQMGVQNYSRFQFSYDLQNQHNASIVGKKNIQKISNRTHKFTLNGLQKQISNKIVMNTIMREDRYSRGIKTYRLFEKQLYNIDLEDKQKYVEQFFSEEGNKKVIDNLKTNEKDLYIFVCLIVLVMAIFGLSMNLNYKNLTVEAEIIPQFSKFFKIVQFKLYMNRMGSIVRDIKEQRYSHANRDWKIDLLYTYDKLKLIRSQTVLFKDSIITIPYRDLFYKGTLNQFMDVVLSHLYSLTMQYSVEQINYFQKMYLFHLNYIFLDEMQSLKTQIQNFKDDFMNSELILMIVMILLVLSFYILLILLIVLLNNLTIQKLKILMMMSDAQARMRQSYADKLNYALDMIRKNFDIDLKNVLGPIEHHKDRKKPKDLSIGMQKKAFIGIIGLICLGVHTVIIYNLYSSTSNTLTNILKIRDENQNIVETYSKITGLTNRMYYSKMVEQKTIKVLRARLSKLAQNRGAFMVDSVTNELIDSVFYESSCSLLQKIGIFENETVPCSNCVPGYIVHNPFDLGLVSYFSRSHYNIIDNITDNFGFGGIYSRPFIKIFAKINEDILKYGIKYSNDEFYNSVVINAVCIVFGVIYFVVAILVFFSLKNTTKQINQLLKFIYYQPENHTEITQKKKKRKQKRSTAQFDYSQDQEAHLFSGKVKK